MITYKNIGIQSARLANQLSQYAAVLGLAYKKGYEFAVPYENYNKYGSLLNLTTNEWIKVNFRVPEGFKITAPQLEQKHLESITHEYDELKSGVQGFDPKFFELLDNTNLEGFFQCEKYWIHITNIIRKEFQFKDEFLEPSSLKIESLRNKFGKLVAIHIRRGDYIGIQNEHPVLSEDYYQKALENFSDIECGFIVFSDDIEYCKYMFGEDERIYYVENNIDFIDMCMMSLCDHNIIANSTFSWWAAWLNTNINKKVVAPLVWLGPKIKHLETKDLYCEGWIVI